MSKEFVELDLMSEGLPIIVQSPPDPEIEKNNIGLFKDYTLKKGDNYYIQIYSTEAFTFDAVKIKNELLQEVKSEPFFSKIIQEDDHGFIYEKQIDEETIDYDFRHVRIQGNNQYLFQTGLIGQFSESAVRAMYKAVQ